MRIQIVDDNDINLMLFQQLALRTVPDITVTTHLDPRDALAACREKLPDLIVVDYMMPGMDGHEYVRQVRQMPGGIDIPIVMVTAAADRTIRHTALELGVTDFLTKPVDPTEVRVRLANLLALRRSHLKLQDRNRWLADEIGRATAMVIEREQELILRLSKAAEFRDPETGAHIQRMACYSQLIAQCMGLPEDICDLLLRAAPMHDVGKLGIPDGILLKPGKLTDEEYRVMTRHPEIGHAILDGSASPLIRMGAEIALTHHEKYDGSGYPNRLAGDDIPLLGRIVAVADVFDALTSERPYKAAWTMERARQMLADSSGAHFDPACVEAFLSQWDKVGTIRAKLADEPLELAF